MPSSSALNVKRAISVPNKNSLLLIHAFINLCTFLSLSFLYTVSGWFFSRDDCNLHIREAIPSLIKMITRSFVKLTISQVTLAKDSPDSPMYYKNNEGIYAIYIILQF